MTPVSLEDLVNEAYDHCDWSQIFPSISGPSQSRLDVAQGIMARVCCRLAKIRELALKLDVKDILAVLDGTDEPKAT